MRLILSFILAITIVASSHGNTDSLWTIFNSNNNHDTIKVQTAFDLADQYYRTDIDTTFYLCNEALELSLKHNYRFGLSESYGWLGYLYEQRGLTAEALKYFLKAYEVRKEMKDSAAIANTLNNIGYIYDSQKEHDKAIEHYQEVISIRKALKDSFGLANTINNMAYAYDIMKQYDTSLNYYFESLQIRRKIRDAYGVMESYNNIGGIYRLTDQLDSALFYYDKALKLAKALNNAPSIAGTLNSIATIYALRKDVDTALEYAAESFEIAKNNQLGQQTYGSAWLLYRVYKSKKDYQKALKLYDIYINTKDSVNELANQKDVIKQQTKYEFEKEQLIKEQAQKEHERIEKEKLERRDNLQYSVIFIIILAVFGSILALGFLKISTRFAEGLIFFAFLIFFEFLLVLSDPFIESVTGGAPGFKLLLNALIAALIFPLHAFFESSLKKKISKSNN